MFLRRAVRGKGLAGARPTAKTRASERRAEREAERSSPPSASILFKKASPIGLAFFNGRCGLEQHINPLFFISPEQPYNSNAV